jgi:D-lyxose ketol-isomerase
MDELNKGLAVAFRGPEAERAITAFRRQVTEWGVALPPAELLVLDFGLGRFAKVGLIECWICNEVQAGYCGKYLFVFDGQTCPRHRHREKHETFFVVKGRVRMEYGGSTVEMKPGDVLPLAPGTPHSFTGLGPALLLEVSKPCLVDDNYFDDAAIPIGGNYRRKA